MSTVVDKYKQNLIGKAYTYDQIYALFKIIYMYLKISIL